MEAGVHQLLDDWRSSFSFYPFTTVDPFGFFETSSFSYHDYFTKWLEEAYNEFFFQMYTLKNEIVFSHLSHLLRQFLCLWQILCRTFQRIFLMAIDTFTQKVGSVHSVYDGICLWGDCFQSAYLAQFARPTFQWCYAKLIESCSVL